MIDGDLLKLLQQNRGRVVSYDALARHLFPRSRKGPEVTSAQRKEINEAVSRLRERLHPMELIGLVRPRQLDGVRLLYKPTV